MEGVNSVILKSQMENEFVSLLEKILRHDSVELEDLTEWLVNNKVEKITDDYIVVIRLNEETVKNKFIEEYQALRADKQFSC